MAQYIARINILFSANDAADAHEKLTDIMSSRPGVESWDYVTVNDEVSVTKTSFMPVPEPDLDELFEAAISDE